MKRNQFSYSRLVAAILIVAAISCSVALFEPASAKTRKYKSDKTSRNATSKVQSGTVQQTDSAGEDLPVTAYRLAAAGVRPALPAQKEKTLRVAVTDETRLVNLLMTARLVDQVKGFVVEKQQDRLYINGVQQSHEVATRYLAAIKKDFLRVQVFSMEERMRQHPDVDFIQLLLPCTFSSPCVDTRPAKEGC